MSESAQEQAGHQVRHQPRVTRRGLRLALGVLWLLDGALQLQPFMFGPDFASQALASAGSGQPGWVSSGVTWAAHLVGAHPAPWNTLFAVVQLALGVGLLLRPFARLALAASVGWAVAVWYLGEGLGGLASGHASLVAGAPGAVALYALLAFVAWPSPQERDGGVAPPSWTPVAWAVVWIGGAVLQALPGQNTADALADSLSGDDMPGWLMPLDTSVADGVRHLGAASIWLLAAVLVAVGLGGLGGRRLRSVAGWVGIVAAVVFWVVGQGLGDLFSGQATDPDSGPLLVLLAVALLGVGATAIGKADTTGTSTPATETDGAETTSDEGADDMDDTGEDDEPELAPEPGWRVPVLSGVTALAVVGVGLLLWATTRPTTPPPAPHLTVSAVYTPIGSGVTAPVYLTLANTGDGSDTLLSAGTEFQTAAAASGIEVCGSAACPARGTVTVPAHSTMVFGSGGPHLLVAGLGMLTTAHQPLQVTLTFAQSGIVHVLSPIGSPADLTQDDVMTYGFMGHKDPGMNMSDDGSDGMTGMTGMPDMTAPATTAPARTAPATPTTTTMPDMPDMSGMPGMSGGGG
jgi:copper(I)-binding protein